MEELKQLILEKSEEIEDLLQEVEGIIGDIGEEIADYILDNDIVIKTKTKRKAFIKELFEKVLDNKTKSAIYINSSIDKIGKSMEDVLSE